MSWSDLVKNGCSWVHAVQVAGLPYVFVEHNPPRVDSAATPAAPSGFGAVVSALHIAEGMKVSCKIERLDGFGSGDALTLVLSFDGLDQAGVRAELFQNPDEAFVLKADMGAGTGTVGIEESDWPSSSDGSPTYGHIGGERIEIGDTTTYSAKVQARGLAGSRANVYSSRSPTCRIVTNKPTIWRGREVTLWRHLVSPEGRILDSTWCDSSSTYCRVLWRGYVDDPPALVAEGFALRCLPLMRRPSLPIGNDIVASIYQVYSGVTDGNLHNFTGTSAAEANAYDMLPMYIPPGTVIGFWAFKNSRADYPGGVADQEASGTWVVNDTHPDNFFTFQTLLKAMFSSTLAGGAYVDSPMFDGINAVASDVQQALQNTGVLIKGGTETPIAQIGMITELYDARYSNCFVQIVPGAHPFQVNTYPSSGGNAVSYGGYFDGGQTGVGEYWAREIEYKIHCKKPRTYQPGQWMPIFQTQGDAWQDVVFPTTGYGLIDDGEAQRVIKWSAAQYSFSKITMPGLIMLLIESVVSGGVTHDTAGATLEVLAGLVGDVRKALLTLLESSGAANRGTYDTLAQGQGYALHEDLINEASFARPGLTDCEVDFYIKGSTSLTDLVGGHTALRSLCMVQRCTDPDATEAGATMPGDCQLTVVSCLTTLVDDSSTEIAAGDVLLEAIDAPASAEIPNVISIETAADLGGPSEGSIIVQDLPRIQAEGVRDASFNAPNMTHAEALHLGAALLAQGNGQQVLTMRVAPWVEVQPGTPLRLTLAHPMFYEWTSATRAPATISGKCVGWSSDLVSGMQEITVLIAGAAVGVGYLCPSVSVVSVDSTTDVTVALLDTTWLTADDWVRMYNPGKEQGQPGVATAEYDKIQIDSVSTTTGRVVFKTTLESWVAAGTIITYPATSETVRQARFIHNRTTDRLG